MKLNKYIIGALLASTVVASCDIERFPYSSIESGQVTNDPDYLKNAMTGVYADMKGTGSASWINNAHRLLEYGGDNVALSGQTTDNLYYIYNYQRVDDGDRSNDFWTRSYRTIAGCNKIIENAKEGQGAANDHSLGEAYFLRAMMHFYLVNVYGRPYNQGRDNLGVPLKITSDRNDIPGRATVGQVYDQVIKDLNKAIDLMTEEEKTSVKESFYATIGAAKGLLSRVYLYMEDNANALKYADEVLDMDYELLDAEEFRKMNNLNPEQNSESIFAIKYMTDLDEGNQYNNVGSFYASIGGYGWGEMYASSTYIDLVHYFPDDARQAFFENVYAGDALEGRWVDYDTQKDGFKKPVYHYGAYSKEGEKETLTYSTKVDTTKKTVELQKETTPAGVDQYYIELNDGKHVVYLDKTFAKRNDYPKIYILKCSLQEGKIHAWSPILVRLAEIYLNKAEALYKLGRSADAITVLNELRSHRDVPPYTQGDAVSGRGKTDLLDVILDERRLELAYEGHRALDVFRNKKILDRNYPGTHAMDMKSLIEISWQDNCIVQLIPLTQLNAQGEGLVQNPL